MSSNKFSVYIPFIRNCVTDADVYIEFHSQCIGLVSSIEFTDSKTDAYFSSAIVHFEEMYDEKFRQHVREHQKRKEPYRFYPACSGGYWDLYEYTIKDVQYFTDSMNLGIIIKKFELLEEKIEYLQEKVEYLEKDKM